jgi:drug/metabolite transporter (DMT)-like permease
VAISVSHFWLHESLLPLQWIGAAFLAASLILI